ARAPLSRPGGLRDVFSAPARASDLTRTQDRSPAAVEVVGDKSFPLVRQRSRRSLTGSKAALGGVRSAPSRSRSGALEPRKQPRAMACGRLQPPTAARGRMRRESQPRPRIEGLALPVRRALVRNWSDVATDVAMRSLGVAVLARNCTCRCAGLLGPAITCVMSPQAGSPHFNL